MLTVTHTPKNRHISSGPHQPSTPKSETAEPDGIRDAFQGAVRWVAGKAIGLAFGTGTLAANAAAGGAQGMMKGARIQKHEKLVFHSAMTLNLAAFGLGGGPVGAALSVVGGHLLWRIEGEDVRQKVTERADQWVGKTLEKLPGDPAEAGTVRRAVNGAVGEVVGAAAGAWAGTFAMFDRGEALGHKMADNVTNQLFE